MTDEERKNKQIVWEIIHPGQPMPEEKEDDQQRIIEECKKLRDQSPNAVMTVGQVSATHELVGNKVVQTGGDELPKGGRIWRIEGRRGRKDGKESLGWSARYGRRHNREFMDGPSLDIQESRRKAIEWLWSQHKDYGGNTGGEVVLNRWTTDKVKDRAQVLMKRLQYLSGMTAEELLEKEGGTLKEVLEDTIMALFDLDDW